MNTIAKRAALAIAGLGAIALATGQARADYSYTTIAFPGARFTNATGINDLGQVVGTYTDAGTGGVYSYLMTDSNFTTISAGTVFGINDLGQVVGFYSTPSGERGFVLTGSTITTIGFPGAHDTDATGINDSGQVVGYYGDASNNVQGFLMTGSTYKTISFPGAMFTLAFGINNLGQVVGEYEDGTGEHGFLLSGSVYSTISEGGAAGINDSGQLVGGFENGASLLTGSVLTTLNPPGSITATAYGINDLGQVVGYYTDAAGDGYGYIATIPEPSSLVLVFIGLSLIGVACRRRRRAGA